MWIAFMLEEGLRRGSAGCGLKVSSGEVEFRNVKTWSSAHQESIGLSEKQPCP